MKFTSGYWMVRDGVTPLYAVEYADHRVMGNELVVYAPSKHITDRGDCLNIGMLTVYLSSPAADVIQVSVRHFEGAVYHGPFAQINQANGCGEWVRIEETETELRYQSGNTTAVIDKRPNSWGIRFLDGERVLTDSAFRNMAYMKNTKTGKSYMLEQLALDVDEYVYGLGERFTPFVKNGQTVDMWNEDGGTASEIAYKNIPFYISNKGYGVLVDNEGDVSFEIASEKVERVQFSVQGERLDYYLINGSTPKGTVSKYTELTGKPALPPAWSFGLWLTTSFTTSYDEQTTSGFIKGMADRDIPLHVFHFDCYWMEAYEWCNFTWDPKTFPEPREMLRRYHEKGLRICVWINPYIGQKSPLFHEGMRHGYLVKKENGDVWQTDLWQAGMALVDFTNPAAAAWYQEKLKTLLDMGVVLFLDFSMMQGMGGYGLVWKLLAGICLVFWIMALYLFPMLARFDNTLRAAVNNALVMAARHPRCTLAMLAVTGAGAGLTLLTNGTVIYGIPFWILIGFAFISYVNARFLRRVFDQYEERERN